MCRQLRFTQLTPCNALLDCICYRYAGNGMRGETSFCGANSLLELHAAFNDCLYKQIVGVTSMVMMLDC